MCCLCKDAPCQVDILAIRILLDELATENARLAEVVELRFFTGMAIREVAVALDVSESTVEADWRSARAWLRARLKDV